MAKLIWSLPALQDVDGIAGYIWRDSPDNAALFIDRLIEQTTRLTENPFSGRIIPEIGTEHARELIYGSYRIMYAIHEDEVWITGVIHGARDWKPK